MIRSAKQKATANDGLIACYVWLPLAGFESMMGRETFKSIKSVA
jgi:hypothetical protein